METGPECPQKAQEYLAAGIQVIGVYRERRDVCLGSRPQGFQKVCFWAFLSRIWLCSFFPGIFGRGTSVKARLFILVK